MSIASTLAAQPILRTERLTLEQLGPARLDDVLIALADPEAMRLTGTHATFTREQVLDHLRALPSSEERADFAILDRDGRYVGEVVLNELDEHNRSMNYRIALASPSVRGVGFGTEAGRAVVGWAFDAVGLHRISLGVYAFNPAAQRSYEKIGFRVEGVERHALLWDGHWHDAVRMAMLATDPR